MKNNYDNDPIKVMENPDEAEISEFTQPVDDDAATAMPI